QIYLGTLKMAIRFDPKLIVWRSVPLKTRFRPDVAAKRQPFPLVIFSPRGAFLPLIVMSAIGVFLSNWCQQVD
ncbi:MAG TPA: hypothetical protein VFZ54_17820, partial [Burkholderiales bacterium]